MGTWSASSGLCLDLLRKSAASSKNVAFWDPETQKLKKNDNYINALKFSRV